MQPWSFFGGKRRQEGHAVTKSILKFLVGAGFSVLLLFLVDATGVNGPRWVILLICGGIGLLLADAVFRLAWGYLRTRDGIVDLLLVTVIPALMGGVVGLLPNNGPGSLFAAGLFVVALTFVCIWAWRPGKRVGQNQRSDLGSHSK
jgi:uncharacterized protein (DUF983 family)